MELYHPEVQEEPYFCGVLPGFNQRPGKERDKFHGSCLSLSPDARAPRKNPPFLVLRSTPENGCLAIKDICYRHFFAMAYQLHIFLDELLINVRPQQASCIQASKHSGTWRSTMATTTNLLNVFSKRERNNRHHKNPGVHNKNIEFSEDFLSEPIFRSMLFREYRRTERTQNPFILFLIDIARLVENEDTGDLNRIHSIIRDSTREIDIVGWYEQEKKFGIIYADFSLQASPILIKRLMDRLSESLEPDVRNRILTSYYQFPQSNEGENETAKELLYLSPAQATPARRITLAAKRGVDFSLALISLIVLSPFFVIVALLIKATSPGPVFFRQERVGMGGKRFTIFKFRSMFVNNDPSIHKQFVTDLINGKNAGQEYNGKKVMKITNDPRVTGIGRFIRKTSIDELPQLINVLRGDMSFVGPRPPIPYEVEAYSLWHRRRVMDVKPGITGIWQVYGRSITDFDGMVRMDISYIKRQSLLLDLKLLVKTPFSLFSTSGAF